MKPFAVTLSIIAGLLMIGMIILLISSGGNLRAAFGAEERTLMSWSAESAVTSIKIETTDDNVDFRTSDDGSVSVTYYQSDAHSFEISQDGGALSIIARRTWMPSFHFGRNYTMTVAMPAQELEKLDISVSSGGIAFDMGIRVGSLTAHSSSGSVALSNFTADTLNAGVTSGNINISKTNAGTAELYISSGNITLADADIDNLKTNATSGPTRLENCSIRQLDMHATSGNITGINLNPGSVTVGVTSGNVDLELAVADPKLYKLELSSTSGGITVSGGGYDSSASRSLNLGSGGQLVKVGVTSGNIIVKFTYAAE